MEPNEESTDDIKRLILKRYLDRVCVWCGKDVSKSTRKSRKRRTMCHPCEVWFWKQRKDGYVLADD